MRSMTTDEIRQAYLNFFSKEGHAVIPGASLIPENDPTVLFTTAGMHPLVPYLLGETHPAGKRLCDVQKCIRTQDIDEVGDASHLTFFEMLGNWSLGDYFKQGAITMSFTFLTDVLQIPVSMLAVTCFAGDEDAPKDEESAQIWENIGIPPERIGFLPKTKNWWGPAGQTGPCGPDTEMFIWAGNGEPKGNPATHDSEWMEIWNDVFMQYNKKADGAFAPLKQRNVDTGMGLERAAKVLQGVKSVYETDAFRPIMETISNLLHLPENKMKFSEVGSEEERRKVEEQFQKHPRIICDHLRAATFMIVDGVRPSNVDQGYVLRRLIRRAIRSAWRISKESEHLFTTPIIESIVTSYKKTYPSLHEQEKLICSVVTQEEEQFKKTLAEGLKQFNKSATDHIDGLTAFHLYDTYGFPLELTMELAKERGKMVDVDGYKKAFAEHQALSRAGAEAKFKGGLQDHSNETTKLHTATHLLDAALRKVLGDHVFQKGSNITAERLRFDFSHPDKMTPEQVKEVERLVNESIAADLPVTYHVTDVEGAKKEGAIGVFDARYGAEVKVYTVGAKKGIVSKEICGGPHVARTGMLGAFKILKEESSSAGIRRIKAILNGGTKEIEVAKEER
ncbi:MAG: alanine--tRNA ligase [Candidatus Peribacteraceae bacterium]|nr:alanine--tRNA ligase [Candidatus Peribacteraceae bacterium]MDD5741938.1 alanine--tRNA ligase [Candidatus Peribacteraceae bacterium]